MVEKSTWEKKRIMKELGIMNMRVNDLAVFVIYATGLLGRYTYVVF